VARSPRSAAVDRRGVALSRSEARRLALAAQGFADPRPIGAVDRRHVRRTLGRVRLIQVDSVNVLVRSHYLPLFSRLGPYDPALLDRMAYERRELFEYWGHEASLIPVALQPLFRWRMARAANGEIWQGMARIARERPEYVEAIYQEVVSGGPLSASGLSDPGDRGGPWWGWADGKRALEWLFWTGRLSVAGRRNFERLYDLPERVIPPEILAAPTPPEEESHRALLRLATRALGVATASDLADYFRLRVPDIRPRLAELVEEGALIPAEVEGWRRPAYLDPAARIPRWIRTAALLSPFDSLVWERARAERLFDFHLRIEIYTPAPKRTFGYYVLPFLLDDRLVARVDLKADRKAGALLAPGAYLEAGAPTGPVAQALAAGLWRLAAWLGLERIVVGERGDLSGELRAAVAGTTPSLP
jgi:uncharacterized protein YcaQ